MQHAWRTAQRARARDRPHPNRTPPTPPYPTLSPTRKPLTPPRLAAGDPINDIVMITDGEVLMSKRVTVTTNTIPPEMKEVSVEVARCGAGTLMGDIEIIRKRNKYMETSVCTGVVTVCVIRCQGLVS